MNHLKMFCSLVLLTATLAAVAQDAKPAAKPAAPPPTVGSAIDVQIGIVEREFVGAAEAMPDDKFNFSPAGLNINGSEYKGVKTFAEEVRHVAATNFALWDAVTGDKP